MKTLAAILSGRCANGWERDHGSRVHAVPYSAGLERGDYTIGKALCGAKPGPRSAGWSRMDGNAITCPKCLKKHPQGRQTDADGITCLSIPCS